MTSLPNALTPKSKSILIVDDSEAVRRVARRILEVLGYQVNEALDGLQALEICAQTMPETILLDWSMPNMNGLEFLRELRDSAGGEIPIVVFCTTESSMAFIRSALTAGADEIVIKPFDRATLINALRRASTRLLH
jgi:two-component system chemotaxis response regulator CheY